MVYQSTNAKSETYLNLTNSSSYPKNENGKTYGYVADATPIETLPDLILAGNVEGTAGYMLKKDYLGEEGRIVSLYNVDGKTIIGSISSSALHQNPAPNYQKNENGQTYGSAADAISPETEPELISAIGVDGTQGYVLKKDIDGEQPKSPKEAIAIQNSRSPGGREIPLYDADGETVIGVFHVGEK